MTRFWWIRHGPTHAEGMVGWTDLPADLSDQARIARLAAALPHAPVISSDLSRAVATADAIGMDRPRLPHDPALREIHFGAWEMKRHDEVERAELMAFYDTPGDIRAPGGESWNDIRARVDGAVAGLIRGPAQDVIVVAHMGAILTQVQRAMNLAAADAFGHRIDNLSITRISFDGDWRAEVINHAP